MQVCSECGANIDTLHIMPDRSTQRKRCHQVPPGYELRDGQLVIDPVVAQYIREAVAAFLLGDVETLLCLEAKIRSAAYNRCHTGNSEMEIS